jgi:hypothetical protein
METNSKSFLILLVYNIETIHLLRTAIEHVAVVQFVTDTIRGSALKLWKHPASCGTLPDSAHEGGSASRAQKGAQTSVIRQGSSAAPQGCLLSNRRVAQRPRRVLNWNNSQHTSREREDARVVGGPPILGRWGRLRCRGRGGDRRLITTGTRNRTVITWSDVPSGRPSFTTQGSGSCLTFCATTR